MCIDVFDAAISLCHQVLGLLQRALLQQAVAGDLEGVHELNSTVSMPPLLGVERTAARMGLNVLTAYLNSVAIATELSLGAQLGFGHPQGHCSWSHVRTFLPELSG